MRDEDPRIDRCNREVQQMPLSRRWQTHPQRQDKSQNGPPFFNADLNRVHRWDLLVLVALLFRRVVVLISVKPSQLRITDHAPSLLCNACQSLPKNKKPGHPFPGNPAIFPSLEETRGFPSPPRNGFGFILDEFFLTRFYSRYKLSESQDR